MCRGSQNAPTFAFTPTRVTRGCTPLSGVTHMTRPRVSDMTPPGTHSVPSGPL